MHLVSQVVFDYNIGGVLSGDSGIFNDDAELKAAVQKMFNGEMMTLDVARTVKIVDKDHVIYPNGISRFFIDRKTEFKTAEFEPERVKVFVVDKLWYPNNVREFLMKNYGSILDFNPKSKTKPICDFHVSEYDGPIATNQKTRQPVSCKVKTVHYRTVEKGDIFVDNNLNQIWPKKTGKMPVALTNLLAKKTEKVYEG